MESINIEQSVKQGDALSCSFYMSNSFSENKTNKKVTLWEPSKGSHLDPRGPTLLLLTVVLLWVLQFLPTIPLLGRGMPPRLGNDKQ